LGESNTVLLVDTWVIWDVLTAILKNAAILDFANSWLLTEPEILFMTISEILSA